MADRPRLPRRADPDLFDKPIRFANVEIAPPIYLDEDVAEVFDSSEAVNTVLPQKRKDS
jgi:hypothetical protein